MKVLSRIGLFGTPWTVAHQASLSMGSSRQEYWRPFPSPGDLPNPGITTGSPELQEDSVPSEPHCAHLLSHVRLCDTMNCSLPGFSVLGNSSGKNTGVGCHALLQGTFPTKGSNPGLPHCRWILYHLNYQRRLWAILGIICWWFLLYNCSVE